MNKSCIFASLLVISLSAGHNNIWAQVKSTNVTVPVEHQWLYFGDGPFKLNFNVQGEKGDAVDLDLALVTDKSLMSEIKDTVKFVHKKIKTKGGERTATIRMGSLEPGFYQAQLSSKGEKIKNFNIGVNPEQIVSLQDKKPDFDEFWDNTLSELAKVPIDATMTVDSTRSNDQRTTYIVKMKSLGDVEIAGILCMPNKPGKYVTYIDYLGYGANPIWYKPEDAPETIEFLLSVRDQGILKRKDHYRWIDRGLDSKENFYYRGAFADVVRAIDFVCTLPGVDMDRLFARGESQGGAFTFISVSLDHRIKACAPSVPFLSDFEDYWKIVRWPMWEVFAECEKQGISREQILDMFTYFDVKNFVDRIQCPVYMAFGLQDATCPPHTNFADYNLIKTPKEYYCNPERGHDTWCDPQWFVERAKWFDKILQGISQGNN